jgi:hypothetical protein
MRKHYVNLKVALQLKALRIRIPTTGGWTRRNYREPFGPCVGNFEGVPSEFTGIHSVNKPTYDEVLQYLRERRLIDVNIEFSLNIQRYRYSICHSYNHEIATKYGDWVRGGYVYKTFQSAQFAAISTIIDILINEGAEAYYKAVRKLSSRP